MTAAWCCAYTHPSEELRASAALQERGFRVFLPRISLTTPRGERREMMFPRYLFVELDVEDEAWRPARYARGVLKLLGTTSEEPSPIRGGLIESLIERCGDGGVYTISKYGVKAGDRIRIVAGPFKDFEGLCVLSAKDRVAVMLEVFGRSNRTVLRAADVERVSEWRESAVGEARTS